MKFFKQSLSSFYGNFLRGLLAILPIAITIYLFIWLIGLLESMTAWVTRLLLPDHWYAPVIGVAVGIAIIMFIGWSLQSWVAQRFGEWCEFLVKKTPVVSDIYEAIKDMISYFTGRNGDSSSQVVMVTCARDPEIKLIGIVTREDFEKAPAGIGEPHMISVYLPMSYQIGGYTVYIDKSHCTPIDMKKKDAIKWVLMGGVENK